MKTKYTVPLWVYCAMLAAVFGLNIPVVKAATSPSGMVSDAFNGSLNNSVWTFVDPVGDTNLSVTGSQTAISLPAGSGHDLWAQQYDAPRLLQKANNTDFSVEIKIDSPMSLLYQVAGIIVEKDADELMRFDVYHDGNHLNIFSGIIFKGKPDKNHAVVIQDRFPLYMRIKRTKNSWAHSYSYDGKNWIRVRVLKHGIKVKSVGVFAANPNPDNKAPAYTGLFDYFIVDDIPPEGGSSGSDTTPPKISNVQSAVTDSSATLTWKTNEAADSGVNYGTSKSYGSTQTDAALVTAHSITLTGLQADKRYHYQLQSTDASGNTRTTGNFTFKTDTASASSPSGLVSDAFNGSLNTAVWSFVDPLGNSNVSATGTQTAIAVKAGNRHNLWKNALNAPRFVQAANNTDFSVDIKIDSAMSLLYQVAGLIVEQDANDLMRFDVYHDGSKLTLFSGAFVNGRPAKTKALDIQDRFPIYLRVQRAGNQWTHSYSYNGNNWTEARVFNHTLNVSTVGLFTANPGSKPPAYTALFDYFTVDATPGSGGGGGGSGGNIQQVRWTRLSSNTGDLPVPPVNEGESGLKVVDLDNDGQTDYVLAMWNTPETLIWYKQAGNRFNKYVIDKEKTNLSHTRGFKDIDNDGDIDLIIGDAAEGNTISWWENPRPNYNSSKPWVRRDVRKTGAKFIHDAIWGDFDGDGKDEFMAWNQKAFQLLFFEVPSNPKTSGTWPVKTVFTWTGGNKTRYRGTDAIDINLDGKVDFVGGCGWFEHTGGSNFTQHMIDDAAGYGTIVAGQLVKGGRPEVVCQREDKAAPLKMYEWTGSTWKAKTIVASLQRSHTLEIGDINGDGNLDLLVAEMGHWGSLSAKTPLNPNAKLLVLYGDGGGDFIQQTLFVGQGHLEGQLGDIDDDGDLDIVTKPFRHMIPQMNMWINDGLQ